MTHRVRATLGVAFALVFCGLAEAAPRSCAQAGDSRLAGAFKATPHGFERREGSVAWWLNQKGKVHFSPENSVAVSRTNSDHLVAVQLPAVLAIAPRIDCILLLDSTNDRSTMTADQSISNLRRFLSGVAATGKPIVIIAEMPRGTVQYPNRILPFRRAMAHQQVRNWILYKARRLGPNIYVADVWSVLADPAVPAQLDPAVTDDGLHPNAEGNRRVADVVWPLLVDHVH